MTFIENREPAPPRLLPLNSIHRLELHDLEPVRAQSLQASNTRRLALLAVSVFLSFALLMVLVVAGSAVAEAAPLFAGPAPEFSATEAFLAKQDEGVGGLAIAAVAVVALAMLTLIPAKSSK